MRKGVKWTNLSRRQISRKLIKIGTPAGKGVVSRLLKEHGYHRRKAQKRRTMGQHSDRNTQFENIARLRKEYLSAGNPVLSIDTKKKELLGNFYREGVTDGVESIIVNDHDFPSYADGKVIPHGILDLGKNKAALHLNTSSDTSELACHSIELWWQEEGKKAYPEKTDLLILCDGGGSNSARSYLFKADLQALANRLELNIRIAHYPPYCSKYNPIEHRLFPHVTHACKGVPLETVEVAKHYMEKTETSQGLSVTVRIIDKVFEVGRKYAADFIKNMTIRFDELLPKWNYTASPQIR